MLESTESLIENLKRESFRKRPARGKAAAAPGGGGKRPAGPSPAAAAAPDAGPSLAARPLPPPRRLQKAAGPPRDPELQDRLSALERAAEGASKRAGGSGAAREGCLSQCSCRRFAIGRARASALSRVDFFGDRLEYDFRDERRQGGAVRMVMYFRDMRDARVDYRRPALVFRLARPLDMFTADYDPADPTAVLRVEFGDSGELSRHVEALLPRMVGP